MAQVIHKVCQLSFISKYSISLITKLFKAANDKMLIPRNGRPRNGTTERPSWIGFGCMIRFNKN